MDYEAATHLRWVEHAMERECSHLTCSYRYSRALGYEVSARVHGGRLNRSVVGVGIAYRKRMMLVCRVDKVDYQSVTFVHDYVV